MARQQESQESPRGGGVPGARVLRAGVAEVVARRPGPELVAGLLAVMSGRLGDDPCDDIGDAGHEPGSDMNDEGGGLSAREWVEVAAGWKQVAAFAAAAQLEAVAALDVALQPAPTRRAGVVLAPGRRAADELAPALGIAPQAASRLVALARRAAGPGGDLHRCHDALARGGMDPTQLRIVADLTRDLGGAASGRVQDLAVRRAPRCTAAALRAAVGAEAHRSDPAAADRAAAVGRSERDVVLRASPLPGCRRLVADLPTLAAQGAWTALTAVATGARDRGVRADGTREDRTLAQLRADALTAALTGHADAGDPTLVPAPEDLRTLAEIQVVVTAETLLADRGPGHRDDPDHGDGSGANGGGANGDGANGGGANGDGTSGGGTSGGGTSVSGPAGPGPSSAAASRAALPATIPGAGVLDAAETRRIAATTHWRRLVVDATTGTLLAYGTRTHPPPTAGEPPEPPGGPDLRTDPRWLALYTDPIEAPPAPGTGYTPPPALRRHVHTRDATCIGPACFHTARGTQLDHTTPWTPHAPSSTTAANLASLCHRTHNAKTHGGWTLTHPTPGTLTWTSPTARTYHRTPPPLVTGWPTTDPSG